MACAHRQRQTILILPRTAIWTLAIVLVEVRALEKTDDTGSTCRERRAVRQQQFEVGRKGLTAWDFAGKAFAYPDRGCEAVRRPSLHFCQSQAWHRRPASGLTIRAAG